MTTKEDHQHHSEYAATAHYPIVGTETTGHAESVKRPVPGAAVLRTLWTTDAILFGC